MSVCNTLLQWNKLQRNSIPIRLNQTSQSLRRRASRLHPRFTPSPQHHRHPHPHQPQYREPGHDQNHERQPTTISSTPDRRDQARHSQTARGGNATNPKCGKPTQLEISLTWVAGHRGSIGNEEADKLAKAAAEFGSSERDLLTHSLQGDLPTSLSVIKQQIDDTSKGNDILVETFQTIPHDQVH